MSERIHKLKKAIQHLKDKVTEIEKNLLIFKNITNDCVNGIKRYLNSDLEIGISNFDPTNVVVHYLKIWFGSFIWMRDDSIVSITGVIDERKYYQQLYENYTHDRGDDGKIYKGDPTLTYYSCDGVMFEEKLFTEKELNKYSVSCI